MENEPTKVPEDGQFIENDLPTDSLKENKGFWEGLQESIWPIKPSDSSLAKGFKNTTFYMLVACVSIISLAVALLVL